MDLELARECLAYIYDPNVAYNYTLKKIVYDFD